MMDQIEDELFAIQAAVEEWTGLTSRWQGTVTLFDDISMRRGQGALAEKAWSCEIRLAQALALSPLRWRTLIHEMLHSVSVGTNEEAYKRFIGWEEAVVEQLQRLLRPRILTRLAVSVPEALFVEVERHWRYNVYIEAMESLRQSLAQDDLSFYLELLQIPLADRLSHTYFRSGTREYRRLFAAASGKLR